ncbi:MAG: hypothetical protein F6K52_22025 [Moorea sp. SIO3H5]|nr:hypothetical protein [Moorena sp. SIO3H5]
MIVGVYWEFQELVKWLIFPTYLPMDLAMQRGLGGFPHERLHQELKMIWDRFEWSNLWLLTLFSIS